MKQPDVIAIADDNRVTSLYHPETGQHIPLPENPGRFTIGGEGADVRIPGLEGIVAMGERLLDGSVVVSSLEAPGEKCPCPRCRARN